MEKEMGARGPVTRSKTGVINTPERVLRSNVDKDDTQTSRVTTPKRTLRRSTVESNVDSPSKRNTRASSAQPEPSPVTKKVMTRRRSSSLQPKSPVKESVATKKLSSSNISTPIVDPPRTRRSSARSPLASEVSSKSEVEQVKKSSRRSVSSPVPETNVTPLGSRRRSSLLKPTESPSRSQESSDLTPSNIPRKKILKSGNLSPLAEKTDEIPSENVKSEYTPKPTSTRILRKSSSLSPTIKTLRESTAKGEMSPTNESIIKSEVLSPNNLSLLDKNESCGESEDSGIKEMEEFNSLEENNSAKNMEKTGKRPDSTSEIFEDQNDDPNSKEIPLKSPQNKTKLLLDKTNDRKLVSGSIAVSIKNPVVCLSRISIDSSERNILSPESSKKSGDLSLETHKLSSIGINDKKLAVESKDDETNDELKNDKECDDELSSDDIPRSMDTSNVIVDSDISNSKDETVCEDKIEGEKTEVNLIPISKEIPSEDVKQAEYISVDSGDEDGEFKLHISVDEIIDESNCKSSRKQSNINLNESQHDLVEKTSPEADNNETIGPSEITTNISEQEPDKSHDVTESQLLKSDEVSNNPIKSDSVETTKEEHSNDKTNSNEITINKEHKYEEISENPKNEKVNTELNATTNGEKLVEIISDSDKDSMNVSDKKNVHNFDQCDVNIDKNDTSQIESSATKENEIKTDTKNNNISDSKIENIDSDGRAREEITNSENVGSILSNEERIEDVSSTSDNNVTICEIDEEIDVENIVENESNPVIKSPERREEIPETIGKNTLVTITEEVDDVDESQEVEGNVSQRNLNPESSNANDNTKDTIKPCIVSQNISSDNLIVDRSNNSLLEDSSLNESVNEVNKSQIDLDTSNSKSKEEKLKDIEDSSNVEQNNTTVKLNELDKSSLEDKQDLFESNEEHSVDGNQDFDETHASGSSQNYGSNSKSDELYVDKDIIEHELKRTSSTESICGSLESDKSSIESVAESSDKIETTDESNQTVGLLNIPNDESIGKNINVNNKDDFEDESSDHLVGSDTDFVSSNDDKLELIEKSSDVSKSNKIVTEDIIVIKDSYSNFKETESTSSDDNDISGRDFLDIEAEECEESSSEEENISEEEIPLVHIGKLAEDTHQKPLSKNTRNNYFIEESIDVNLKTGIVNKKPDKKSWVVDSFNEDDSNKSRKDKRKLKKANNFQLDLDEERNNDTNSKITVSLPLKETCKQVEIPSEKGDKISMKNIKLNDDKSLDIPSTCPTQLAGCGVQFEVSELTNEINEKEHKIGSTTGLDVVFKIRKCTDFYANLVHNVNSCMIRILSGENVFSITDEKEYMKKNKNLRRAKSRKVSCCGSTFSVSKIPHYLTDKIAGDNGVISCNCDFNVSPLRLDYSENQPQGNDKRNISTSTSCGSSTSISPVESSEEENLYNLPIFSDTKLNCSAYIHNIGPGINAHNLHELLHNSGITGIEEINLSKCHSELFFRSQGYGTITFSNERELQRCVIKSQKLTIKGQQLWMKPEDSYRPSSKEFESWLISFNKKYYTRLEKHMKQKSSTK